DRGLADLALAAPGLVDVAADGEAGLLLFDGSQEGGAAEVAASAGGIAVVLGRRVEDEDGALGTGGEHLGRRLVVEVEAPVPGGDRDPRPEAEELGAVDRRSLTVEDGGGAPTGGSGPQRVDGLVVSRNEDGR